MNTKAMVHFQIFRGENNIHSSEIKIYFIFKFIDTYASATDAVETEKTTFSF